MTEEINLQDLENKGLKICSSDLDNNWSYNVNLNKGLIINDTIIKY